MGKDTESTARRPAGMNFPEAADGSRSSTRTGVHIVAAALRELEPGLADAALSERQWRRNYPRHFQALVRHALPDGERAIASSRAGLASAWDSMQWWDRDGRRPLQQAWQEVRQDALHTVRLTGRGDPRPLPWQLPYRGELLGGERLLLQLADWESRHIIEPSAAQALRRCVANPDWFDLSDRNVALLGAGAEVGPLSLLAGWRANIFAVDIPDDAVWRRIVTATLAGNATVHFPLAAAPDPAGDPAGQAMHAGADLLTEAPRIADWLTGFDRPLDLTSLAYADGERHVRIAMAMDWIVRAVLEAHAGSSASWLATPTDIFAMPAATARASMRAFAGRSFLPRSLRPVLRLAGGLRCFHPNVEELLRGPGEREYAIADSLVVQQGPNYALAKRLQQWRALEARARGRRVSLNIAPATTTRSVTHNPILAAGYAGADRFGIEVFAPETTRALMAGLWVHDLRCDESAANPARPLAHPCEMFADNACHGGMWACAYLPRTALPFAAALGWARQKLA